MINVFTLTMNTCMRGHSYCSYDPKDLSALHSFQIIVLVLQPATLLFWFTLPALIAPFPATAGSYFQQHKPYKLTVHHLPSNKQQTYKITD